MGAPPFSFAMMMLPRGSVIAASTAAITFATTIDFAAEQSARGGAEDGAGGAFASRVDRAADECAARCADDKADGAVRLLAAQASLRVAPGLALVIAVTGESRRHWDGRRYHHGGGGDG